MARQTRLLRYNMADYLDLTATPGQAPFVIKDTSAAGAPVVIATANGYSLGLAADVEVENLCLFSNDVLGIDIDNLIRVEFLLSVVWASTFPTAASIAFGVASARNDTIDTIAEQALFRIIGNANVVLETDDGTINTDDIATGRTVTTGTAMRFAIDFASAVQTVAPPGTSKAGKGNITFLMDNANGHLNRLAPTQLFDMSNFSGGLQLFAQVQKTSDAAVVTLNLKEITLELKTAP